MRLLPGATIPAHHADDAEIRYLTSGSIEYDGKTWIGGQDENEGTYMYVPHDSDVGEITTKTGGEFYVIELPMLADIEAGLMHLNKEVALTPEMESATA